MAEDGHVLENKMIQQCCCIIGKGLVPEIVARGKGRPAMASMIKRDGL
jgi:hypothetical protein